MNDNNIYVSLDTLELEGKLLQTVTYKPKTPLYVVAVFSALFIITGKPVAVGLGLFMLAIDLLVILKVKDHLAVTIYDQFILVHSLENDQLVRKISYDEIKEWNCRGKDGDGNCVMLKLNTDEVIYKDTFQHGKIFTELNKIMPDKETQAIRRAREREIQKKYKFQFKNPFKKNK